jgi:hypothetical protein
MHRSGKCIDVNRLKGSYHLSTMSYQIRFNNELITSNLISKDRRFRKLPAVTVTEGHIATRRNS